MNGATLLAFFSQTHVVTVIFIYKRLKFNATRKDILVPGQSEIFMEFKILNQLFWQTIFKQCVAHEIDKLLPACKESFTTS
jgi:hypothetical protein